jgi:hypothetical protein
MVARKPVHERLSPTETQHKDPIGLNRRAAAPHRSVEALGQAIGNRALSRLVAGPPRRAIARDLKKEHKVGEGSFKLDLETQKPAGGKNGLKGTIKFHPADAAPDSTKIRLWQVVRVEDLDTGKDYAWKGAEAPRSSMQTKEDKSRGLAGGWFVDHSAAAATPRAAAADPAVSQYYRDYWPNTTHSQDGSKAGKAISDASLWDFPGTSGGKMRFSFETVAQGTDTGHYYGSVYWTFTVKDAAKGEVTDEDSYGRDVTTLNTDEALKAFNEYYKNPGASTAPK